MAWIDYIRVAGLPGNTPTTEVFQGIGSNSLKGDRQKLNDALSAWAGQVITWCGEVYDWFINSLQVYAEGTGLEPPLPSPLSFSIVFPTNTVFKSSTWVACYAAQAFIRLLCNGFIQPALLAYIERLDFNGEDSPGIKLFRKFAFLKQDDPEQGFADLTSLLLLNADKPLEIFLTHGGLDVFLDSVVREDGP